MIKPEKLQAMQAVIEAAREVTQATAVTKWLDEGDLLVEGIGVKAERMVALQEALDNLDALNPFLNRENERQLKLDLLSGVREAREEQEFTPTIAIPEVE